MKKKRGWIIGSRGSTLAMVQARWVQQRLASLFPEDAFEVYAIKTLGDQKPAANLEDLPPKGIFTRAIEEVLLAGQIGIAVHSLKDLPVDLPEGLCLGPVPAREDSRDVLVSQGNVPWAKLPKGARVGTGSDRRKMQLLILRPDLNVLPIRGNVQTRVDRVRPGDLDAVVLARAGLMRLGCLDRIAQVFEPEEMLPAVGQGALALEFRQSDKGAAKLLNALGDEASDVCARAERAFLKALGGGCRVPIGAYARCEKGELTLWGGVFSQKDRRAIRGKRMGRPTEAEKIGGALAKELLESGARKVLTYAE